MLNTTKHRWRKGMVAGYRKGADVQQKELLRRLERKTLKGQLGGAS